MFTACNSHYYQLYAPFELTVRANSRFQASLFGECKYMGGVYKPMGGDWTFPLEEVRILLFRKISHSVRIISQGH